MQIAILAGGLGTRLGAVTKERPKSMVEVLGRPFLAWQLDLLCRHGVTDVVLCVGHLADAIEGHFGDGSAFGVRLRYSDEGDRRLGTAGALKWAEPLLGEAFFAMFARSWSTSWPETPSRSWSCIGTRTAGTGATWPSRATASPRTRRPRRRT
jgi:NDP-sugar pyrophosphorylase family protein